MTKSIDWYSPTNIKSYNKFLNFIIGGRGIGKTYGFKQWAINDFIKNKDSHWKNNLKKFDYALALYETNPERFVVEVMVKKAENKGLVTLVNGSVFWHSMKNRPEMYKFTSWEKFIQYILADMQRYNPAEPNTGNSYETLLNELK